MPSIKEKLKNHEYELTYQISRYRQGDKEAFTEIFNRYFNRLYRFLVVLTNNSSNIDDMLQDTFIKVAVHLDTLKDDNKFKEWIFTICRNTAINYKKKEYIEKFSIAYDLANDDTPEENAIREERENMVREALGRLTEDQRTVIMLSRYENMNYKEIAGVMERKENAIKALAHRAMTRLGEFLERNRNEL